jgi:CheY-like chemotaxis protein
VAGAERRAQASGSRPAVSQAARGGFGTGKRVTVVEDEPTLREMLKAVLERYGFEVSEAMSGEDAEADLRASGAAPDLLVTDVLLRDGLGTEMAARMRAVHPGLRALFISGHSLDILEEQGIAIAPEEFLEKPFTPSQLAETMGRLLATPARPVR